MSMDNGQLNRRVMLVSFEGMTIDRLNALIDQKSLPGFGGLTEQGISGLLSALPPLLPEPLFTTMATGCPPTKHGIISALSEKTQDKPLAIGPSDRKAPALWEYLKNAGYRCHLINLPGTHPAEDEVTVSPFFFNEVQAVGKKRVDSTRSVHPSALFTLIKDQIIEPHQMDAATIRLFIPDAAKIDQRHDRRLDRLARILAHNFTIHAAACHSMLDSDWDFAAIRYNLIDEISHLAPGTNPPAAAWADPHDRELFGSAQEGAYRLADLFLQRLMQLAGKEALICIVSPHGFLPGNRIDPPQDVPLEHPHEHHDTQGMLILHGTGIRPDELIHGTRLEDIAPTLLHYAGISKPKGMTGRCLTEAFEQTQPTTQKPASPPPAQGTPTEDESHRLLAPNLFRLTPDRLNMLQQQHRAQLFFSHRKWMDAARVYGKLSADAPLCREFATQFARSLFFGGDKERAVKVLLHIADTFPNEEQASFIRGLTLYYSDRETEALELLKHNPPCPATEPFQANLLGDLLLQAGQSEQALDQFCGILETNGHFMPAVIGKGRALLKLKRYTECMDAAFSALGLDFSHPAAHEILGEALWNLGQQTEAVQAMYTALKYHPKPALLHTRLSEWLAESDPKQSELHRDMANSTTQTNRKKMPPVDTPENSFSESSLLHSLPLPELSALNHTVPFPTVRTQNFSVLRMKEDPRSSVIAFILRPMYISDPLLFSIHEQQQVPPPEQTEQLIREIITRAGKTNTTPLRYWGYVPENSRLEKILIESGMKKTERLEEFSFNWEINKTRFEQIYNMIKLRGKIPERAVIKPLREVPWHAVGNLIRKHIPAHELILGPFGINCLDRDISMVACLGKEIVGAHIVQVRQHALYSAFLVSSSRLHSKWVIPGIYLESCTAALRKGYTETTLHTNATRYSGMHRMMRHFTVKSNRVSHAFGLEK